MNTSSKTIGIVLSGGGSKGIAHAGALQFLTEQNISPSCIAGTSAGAVVGGLYAFGKKPQEILEFFKSIYFFHWKHLTFKKAGLIDSDSFKSYFSAILGDVTLGELNTPAYITATDLVTGKLKVFTPETKLVDAILASSSFPGMLSPYKMDKKLYSDGGILNHFPTDLLQGKCDYLIGVYVSPLQNIEAKDIQSIKSVTSRAFDLLYANHNFQKFNMCDWLIEPKQLVNYSTFETNKSKMDLIFEIGYNEAKSSFQNLNYIS